MENVREIILDSLLTLEKEQEFSHKLIKAVLDKYNYLESRDKAFIKRVTEGTIERQIEIDYYINGYAKVPVKKMKPLIRCLLRMSVYQLLYMDGVPDSAVCNEACKLADKRKFHNLKGFVNGVLRNIAKNKENLSLPDSKKQPLLYMSVKYSMPEWIVKMWTDDYGKEITEKLLEGLLQIHPVYLRFSNRLSEASILSNLEQLEKAGVELRKSPYHERVYTAKNLDSLDVFPGFARGDFTVQDVSSVLALSAVCFQPDDFVIDVCAAPGGKSIFAAELVKEVLSRDVSEEKVAIIEENAARMGCENIEPQVHDATISDEGCYEKADVVIMDVPCSGLGVMGKKRDIKYRVTPEGFASLEALQKQIVEASWRYVKPGGVLLYSTCTIRKEENEKMVQWITEQFPFEAEEQKQLLPGIMESDGFFYAKLRRKEV